MEQSHNQRHAIDFPLPLFLASILFPTVTRAQAPTDVPVFEITHVESEITFDVEASVDIKGKFDKWDGTLIFASTDVESGTLNIKIQADSVDTGSSMKNGKLKGKDFFDAKNNPYITPSSQQRLCTLASILSRWMATLRFAE